MVNGNSAYLKASEVAEHLNVEISTVYKWCADGVLPSIRVGEKAIRIPVAAFEAYLAREERRSPARALLEEARQVEVDPIAALEHQAKSFHDRTGYSPHGFAQRWREGDIEDTAENSSLLIEALSLREALDRAGIGDRVLAT